MAKERPANHLHPAYTLAVLLIGIPLFLWWKMNTPDDPGSTVQSPPESHEAVQPAPTPALPAPSPEVSARWKTKLETKEWHAEGAVLLVTLSVHNGADTGIKDLRISCDLYGASGTKIDASKATIFDIVKAGQTREFADFNMGFFHPQTDSLGCRITDLDVIN
ncbi:hypothetical protein TUM18999_57410 [Pseudomonas tohonis]|uniref:Uncharacterized protein n=1 Tax=Pseudomonas tohonis TaxID=2725477 RepID=A0A6J4ED59_9PSED|nr:hypothetical protein [Pseudomonas tohonis]BCG27550.1 hypothetical protein TUM18999_57410 [Pseudomonas tohonis]